MWDIISWAIFGLIAGALAKFIKPGEQGGGCLVTSILGIIGALVGGFIARNLLGMSVSDGSFSIGSFLVAVGGAILVLFIYSMLTKKR